MFVFFFERHLRPTTATGLHVLYNFSLLSPFQLAARSETRPTSQCWNFLAPPAFLSIWTSPLTMRNCLKKSYENSTFPARYFHYMQPLHQVVENCNEFDLVLFCVDILFFFLPVDDFPGIRVCLAD